MTVGGVGKRGAVWPTGLDWLAMATAGAASDMAFSSSGMTAAERAVVWCVCVCVWCGECRGA